MPVSPSHALIQKAAERLKGVVHPPEWAPFVKTGVHKTRPPSQPDWWYVRAASVLRTVEERGPIGVNKLRVKYGGKKDRGARPEEFRPGSGNILRKILQQLEAAQLIAKGERGRHKGRMVTPKGRALLVKVSKEVTPKAPKAPPSKPDAEAKPEKAQAKGEKAEAAGKAGMPEAA